MFKDSPGGLFETSSPVIPALLGQGQGGFWPLLGCPQAPGSQSCPAGAAASEHPERGPETRPVADIQMYCFGFWFWDF